MVNGFLLFLKMFKYMTFSERVRFLFRMMQRSSTDLLIFAIVLCVFFMAFGIAGLQFFTSQLLVALSSHITISQSYYSWLIILQWPIILHLANYITVSQSYYS